MNKWFEKYRCLRALSGCDGARSKFARELARKKEEQSGEKERIAMRDNFVIATTPLEV